MKGGEIFMGATKTDGRVSKKLAKKPVKKPAKKMTKE